MKSNPIHRRLWLCAALLGAPGCWRAPQTPLEPAGELGARSGGESLIARANAFASRGDYLRAEQYLNAALAEGADDKSVLPLIARATIADQRYRDAAQYLENHLRRHPADLQAGFLLATVHLSLGQVDLARKELVRVLAGDPHRAEPHYAFAVLLRDEAGDHAGADRHFREYLRLEPDGAHAEEARGALLVELPRGSR